MDAHTAVCAAHGVACDDGDELMRHVDGRILCQPAIDDLADEHTDHSDRRACQGIGCPYGDH